MYDVFTRDVIADLNIQFAKLVFSFSTKCKHLNLDVPCYVYFFSVTLILLRSL